LGCTFHESNGKRWCNPPGRPQLDATRKPITDENGKIAYAPVIEFATKAIRSRWSVEAVAAIEVLMESTTPAEASVMNGQDTRGGQPQESRGW
jgi:hypothetical protein